MARKSRNNDDLFKLLAGGVVLVFILIYLKVKDLTTASLLLLLGTVLIGGVIVLAVWIWKRIRTTIGADKQPNAFNAPPTCQDQGKPLPVPPPLPSAKRFKKRLLLTPTEHAFFVGLRNAVEPEFLVQCKPGLWAVVQEHDWADRNRISQKHLDFVVYDARMNRVVLAIELDDDSHNSRNASRRDQDKDAILAEADIPLLRVPVASVYDFSRIRSSVLTAAQKKG